MTWEQWNASVPPACPTCGKKMRAYGGTVGYLCCDWKLLHRAGGWLTQDGVHVKDERLAGGWRRVDGELVR